HHVLHQFFRICEDLFVHSLKDDFQPSHLSDLEYEQIRIIDMSASVRLPAEQLSLVLKVIDRFIYLCLCYTSHSYSSQSFCGYTPASFSSCMAATTTGLSSLYVTPYHLSSDSRTATVARSSSRSLLTTDGRKYSHFSGFSFSPFFRNAGNSAWISSRILLVNPHMFMDTSVSPS